MRVVLDANVYLSALFSPQGTCAQILRKVANETTWQLVLSESICTELLDCFTRPKILKLTNQSEAALITWFEAIKAIALEVDDASRASGICRDPKDEIYLSAAIASNSAYLITGDQDLLVLQKIKQTHIITPQEFLRKL